MRLIISKDDVHIDWTDPALLLTDDQQQAMRIDQEVIVTAGAGAGKTHTLSLRYVHLLLQLCLQGLPDIEAVLVLTFTEKAAAEMAERCYRRLLALCDAIRTQRAELDTLTSPLDTPLGAHLTLATDRLRDAFDRARIGTFHGFCARVLREFPAETGVPTRTAVAEAIEATQTTELALDRALKQLFRERPEDLPTLLDAFGSRHSLMNAGRSALDRRGVLQSTLEDHASGASDLLTWLNDAAVSVDEAHAFIQDVALPTLDAIRRVAAPGGSAWIDGLSHVVETTRTRPVPAEPVEKALATYAAYRSVLHVLLTAGRRVRRLDHHSVLGTRAQWPDPRRLKRARAAMQVLQGRCTDWADRARESRKLPIQADRDLWIALAAFSRWVLDANNHLQALFDEQRSIDFTDLQLRAVDAVCNNATVRSTLQARIRYLMVDEFQDTDERQWALVEALGRPDQAPSDRIFLVGDPKQAIYGFRGGDITLFRQATRALGAKPVTLADNFRSQPALIHWFNEVFPHVFAPHQDPDAPWEVHYDPMRAGRPDADGRVNVVLFEPQDHHWQSEACARLIANEILTEDLSNVERHPAPPIAILLRTRTHLHHYEDALRRSGLPFVVAQGVGFWSRPEVMDLVNTLHALATANPTSIAGALRSPLFCLTDPDLFDLSDLETFGKTPLHADASATLRRAHARYGQLLRERYSGTVSSLLQHLSDLASTAWTLRPGPAGRQASANADRLIQLATRFDDRGHEGLVHAAEAFLRHVESESRAAEAVIAPTRARVIVMTIHAAKGLEFPVVLIPELNATPRPEASPLAIARLEEGPWRMASAVPDTEADVQKRARPGLLNALRDVREAENYAEYRRILYVAATRARDHLYLVGEHPKATETSPRLPSWAHLLAAHLPATTRKIDAATLLGGAPSAEASVPTAPPPLPALPPLLETVEISASGLDLYVTCPARWYRSVVLDMPETALRNKAVARTLAAVRGQVMHGLLEDGGADDEALIRARWTAAAVGLGYTTEHADALLPTLVEPLLRSSQDPYLQRIKKRPGRAEVGFRVATGHVILRGQIDHLYEDDDGWVVLDYKTESVEGDLLAAAQRHRRQLLAYAWAANQVLRNRGLGPVVAGEVYFTDVSAAQRLGVWGDRDLATVESLLVQVGQTATKPWQDVVSEATRRPRPCDSCGYFGRGCPGSRAE